MTHECPSAELIKLSWPSVMRAPVQSVCPLVSGSGLLHHLSPSREVSEKEQIVHDLVSVVSGLSSGSQASREAQIL